MGKALKCWFNIGWFLPHRPQKIKLVVAFRVEHSRTNPETNLKTCESSHLSDETRILPSFNCSIMFLCFFYSSLTCVALGSRLASFPVPVVGWSIINSRELHPLAHHRALINTSCFVSFGVEQHHQVNVG